MPLTLRHFCLLALGSLSLAAQQQSSFVPVGDNAAWATVGLVLSGVSYGCVKLLERLQNRAPRDTEATARK